MVCRYLQYTAFRSNFRLNYYETMKICSWRFSPEDTRDEPEVGRGLLVLHCPRCRWWEPGHWDNRGREGDMSRVSRGQASCGSARSWGWGQPWLPPDFPLAPAATPRAPMSLANNNLADLLASSWQLLLVTNSETQASVFPRRSVQSDIIIYPNIHLPLKSNLSFSSSNS